MSDNKHRITHYIIPYIGDIRISDLTTHQLETFYQKLLQEPAVPMKGQQNQRKIFLPHTVMEELQNAKLQQDAFKADLGDEYQDYNLVVARENGRPFEESRVMDRLRQLIEQENLPPIVFHSLRHSSTGMKLQLSGGDIKAVQGDTGHAQSNMVTDVYSHIMDDDRKRLALKMDEEFFSSKPQSVAVPSEDNPHVQQVLQLLQNSPEIAEKLTSYAAFLQSQLEA